MSPQHSTKASPRLAGDMQSTFKLVKPEMANISKGCRLTLINFSVDTLSAQASLTSSKTWTAKIPKKISKIKEK